MNQRIIIDTNVLVALIDRRDKWHLVASRLTLALEQRGMSWLYLDCVLNGAIGVLARRAEEQNRLEQFPDLLNALGLLIPKDLIEWSLVNLPMLFDESIEIVRNSQGKLNQNDALIALTCRELGVSAIVSFDVDFNEIAWLKRVGALEDLAGL